MLENLDRSGVFIAEEEFDMAVLVTLESTGVAEDIAELNVFAGGEGFEDGPLLVKHAEHAFDTGEDFEGGFEVVLFHPRDGFLEFVDDEFHPEFAGLVLDDKEEFVVVDGFGEGVLGGENLVESKVAAVVHAVFELGLDGGFEFSGHGWRLLGIGRHEFA